MSLGDVVLVLCFLSESQDVMQKTVQIQQAHAEKHQAMDELKPIFR